jgi:putative ABC transport system ATP-binding protein
MNEFDAVLQVRGLVRQHGRGQGLVRAVDDVDLDIPSGQMLAVMGPSGCGKSSLLHMLGGLERPTSGQVWLAGERIDRASERALARMRRRSVGVLRLFEDLRAVGQTLVIVTHDGRVAATADRMVSMRDGVFIDDTWLADGAGGFEDLLGTGD